MAHAGRRPARSILQPAVDTMIVALVSRSTRTGVLIGSVLMTACSPDRGRPPAEAAGTGADTAVTVASAPAAAEEEWVDLVSRDDDSESVGPRTFRASTSSLRVITRMGSLLSPLAPGRVISNILSDASALPVASVRAEQLWADTVIADTTEIEAGPGELELFVAEHRGLQDWTVTVQERRAR